MSRVLLVDDSPHAQRMGERILAEEGYEVVTVSNAEAALIRLLDVDPDVIVADTVMPGRTGYDICQYVKMSPQHRHVGVILTAGVLENVDEAQAQRVEADAVLRKPFEASALLASVRPLAERAQEARRQYREGGPGDVHAAAQPDKVAPLVPFVAVVDVEQVRAAVTVALDASMARMVDEITKHVLVALESQEANRPETPAADSLPVKEDAMDAESDTAESEPSPWPEPAHRVTTLRRRPGSILGLDDFPADEENPEAQE
ncbi:MAG: response regulator [Bryobacteraceae bacterium]|jgi:CheY-like chemotaxis protein